MSGKFAKEIGDRYGLEFNQRALFMEGAKKYTNLAVYLGAVGAFGPPIWNRANGMDDEEQKAYRESISADWNEFNPMLIQKIGEDKYAEVNTSYQIPATDLMEIANAAMRGDDAEEVVTNAVKATISKLQGEGLGQTINLRLITEAFTNRDLRTGDKLTAKEGLENYLDMAGRYSYEAFTPSLIKKISEGEYGKDKSVTANTVETVLGLRRQITSFETGSSFKMNSIKQDLELIRDNYVAATADAIDGKRVDLQKEYDEANRLYRQKLDKALKHINNYRTLGISDELIRNKALIKLGLKQPELDMLMMGQIPDYSISSAVTGKTGS